METDKSAFKNFVEEGLLAGGTELDKPKMRPILTRYPRLSMLANSVKLDAFEKVKAAIQDMIIAFTERDFCVEEFNTNQFANEKKTREKDELDTSRFGADHQRPKWSSGLDPVDHPMMPRLWRTRPSSTKPGKKMSWTPADLEQTIKDLTANQRT